METHRICSHCKHDLDISLFAKRSDRNDAPRSICIECCKIQQRKWYVQNRELSQQRSHQYYLNNTKKVKQYARNWRLANPTRKLLQGAVERAKQNKLEINITVDDIIIPDICPVLGIPLQINSGGKRAADGSPSLDRTDSSKGYIKGNVAVISHRANAIKNDGTIEEHQKIIDYMKKLLQPT